MQTLDCCPSTLKSGFGTYSPEALRKLFDGRVVSHVLPFDSPSHSEDEGIEYATHIGRISLSGVQPKGGLVIGEDSRLER